MRLIFTTLFFTFIISNNNYGQSNSYPIKNLVSDTIPVAFVTLQKPLFIHLDKEVPFKANSQNLIKNGKDLYLFINGTGRLYKTIVDSNSYHFVRMDSTTHFGYNIGAFPFSYNNKLYNFGGYGLWRANGQLRVFNEKDMQWDIVKINKEISFVADNDLLWYDIKGKKIYIAYYCERNDALKKGTVNKEFVYDVMVFDLVTNDWTKVGVLDSYLKVNLPVIKSITISPWGLLVTLNDKLSIIDFAENRVLFLKESKEGYQGLQREFFKGNYYFKDSTLYFGSNGQQILDSLQFHTSDFIPSGEVVYTASYMPNYWLLIAIAVGITLALGLWWVLKQNAAKKQPLSILEKEVKEASDNKNTPHLLFEEKELTVLKLLIDSSAKAKTCSLEDLNQVLGLTKKPVEVQKKQRSDVIISINKKYYFITRKEVPLIEKSRTEFDKRSFEYFIAYEKLNEVKKLLP